MGARKKGAPERILVGVVGTGFAASAHLDALARIPAVDVRGLVGSSPSRARQAAERLGYVAPVYPDLDALLADVDVVHNCTPNDVHADVTLRSLAAGRHVLSEKPLAFGVDEGAKLVHAAAAAGVVTGVCFTYRHFPLVQQLRVMLVSERVHLVHGSYLQDWLLREDDWNWRLESSRAGSTRAMGDIGSHWIDTVEHVTGDRVASVTADLGRLHEERVRPVGEVETFARGGSPGERYRVDTEDFGSALLRFGSGAGGSFTASQVSPGRKNRLWVELDGSSSAYVWDQEEPNRLWVGRRGEANREWPRDPSLLDPSATPLAHYPGGHQEGWPDALRNLILDFEGAVAAHRNGSLYEPTFASFAEAHHVMQVVEAIVESGRSGGWVTVAEASGEERPTSKREVVT